LDLRSFSSVRLKVLASYIWQDCACEVMIFIDGIFDMVVGVNFLLLFFLLLPFLLIGVDLANIFHLLLLAYIMAFYFRIWSCMIMWSYKLWSDKLPMLVNFSRIDLRRSNGSNKSLRTGIKPRGKACSSLSTAETSLLCFHQAGVAQMNIHFYFGITMFFLLLI
jgi:hypothetical protein